MKGARTYMLILITGIYLLLSSSVSYSNTSPNNCLQVENLQEIKIRSERDLIQTFSFHHSQQIERSEPKNSLATTVLNSIQSYSSSHSEPGQDIDLNNNSSQIIPTAHKTNLQERGEQVNYLYCEIYFRSIFHLDPHHCSLAANTAFLTPHEFILVWRKLE